MRNKGYHFRLFSTLLLLFIFVAKISASVNPESFSSPKMSCVDTGDSDSDSNDDSEKKNENKEFLLESFSNPPFAVVQYTRYCIHNYTLTSLPGSVIIQPPKVA